MRFWFVGANKTLAPDYHSKGSSGSTSYMPIFDDGKRPVPHIIPGDSVDRGNLSVDNFVRVPKKLRPRRK